MFNKDIKFKYSWRPYQEKVLKEFEKYIEDKKINVVAAPGSGKTVLGLELARRLGNPVLILSPTVTIKNQWIDRFVKLFMPEGTKKPEWVSDNVYKLSYFNSITYQGLHYAYKRKIQRNLQETDDEIEEEKFDTEIDIDTYDLIAEIKKNKISTIILDEAHHLKSEWWQSLTKVIESLTDVMIVSLTATPPYDVDHNEWKKYTELCGNIDIEISVPELVYAKNLCPHQDYIYFSYPTKKEKEAIKEYEDNVKDFIENLKSNTQLIEMVKKHPYIQNTENNIEKILDDTEFYSSMIIFLNSANIEIDRSKVKILGHNKKIPQFTVEWVETLLNNIIFSNNEYFLEFKDIIEELKKNLNKIGAIEKRKIYLAQNSMLQKYFVNSLSKLESINQIVNAEYNNLNKDLRMVILTDFLRKEYLFEENIEINKLGVFPIFIKLLEQNSNINMAILTGSIFMIPVSEKVKLIDNAKEKGIPQNEIEFIDLEKIKDYCIVKTTNKYKNMLMNSISKLFSDGNVNIIIGTKSLLGEGWDEPSINSLILASYVGSYVLSNQMRGRAIRTNTNPNKTANVWHLVCASENENGIVKNVDYETLKRRFTSFVGIGYNNEVLESGIERLDIIPREFSKKNIDKCNQETIQISNNRTHMYEKWFELIEKYGAENIKINNQIETKKEFMMNKLRIIQPKRVLSTVLITMIMYYIYEMTKMESFAYIETFKERAIIFAILIIVLNFKFIIQCFRAIKLSTPDNQLKTIGKIVVKSLYEANIIKTNYKNIKVNVVEDNQFNTINLSVQGVTTHENNVILNSIKEVFSEVENQRYIIVTKKKRNSKYYNVSNLLSQKKELAQIFHNNWKKYIGFSYLFYTNSIEGRRVLLEARKNSFDYVNFNKFIDKKKPISDWK